MTLETEKGFKAVWRTSLASKYAPALCRTLAQVVAAAAPRCAFRSDGERLVQPRWELDLASALGKGDQPPADRVAPSCPWRFTTGWEHAVLSWGGSQDRPRRGAAAAAHGGTSSCTSRQRRPVRLPPQEPRRPGVSAQLYTVAVQEFEAWADRLGWRHDGLQELDTALDAYFDEQC